jgi:hypothetical protein
MGNEAAFLARKLRGVFEVGSASRMREVAD